VSGVGFCLGREWPREYRAARISMRLDYILEIVCLAGGAILFWWILHEDHKNKSGEGKRKWSSGFLRQMIWVAATMIIYSIIALYLSIFTR
jgi:hypothetical protein